MLALAAIAGAAAWWIEPWLALPEADGPSLEKRFALVRVLAARATGPTRDADELARAAKRVLVRKPRTSKGGDFPLVSDKQLTKSDLEALTELTSWSNRSGKFQSSACRLGGNADKTAAKAVDAKLPALPAQAYYLLGRLALEASDHERRMPPRVRAALHLGHEMQVRGDLSEYVAGLKLIVDAAAWLKSRKMKPDATFRESAPDVNGLRSALARTAACSVDSLGEATGWGFDAKERFGGAASFPPLGLVSYRRERLVLLDFYGGVLHDTRQSRTFAEVVKACATRVRPRSAALQKSLPDEAVFGKMAKLYTKYASLVGEGTIKKKPRKAPLRSRRSGRRRSK